MRLMLICLCEIEKWRWGLNLIIALYAQYIYVAKYLL